MNTEPKSANYLMTELKMVFIFLLFFTSKYSIIITYLFNIQK